MWLWAAPIAIFAFAALTLTYAEGHCAEVMLCDQLILIGNEIPNFTDTEKQMLCGAPPGPGNPDAWKNIPISQAWFNIKSFLQERGYLSPKVKFEESRLIVNLGEQTRVSKIFSEGAPKRFQIERKRKIVGEVLTPKLLNTLEQWSIDSLKELGYPCPEVKSEGDPSSGQVVLYIEPKLKLPLMAVIEEPVAGLADGILRRYDAFQIGQAFNGHLLSVTEDRTVSSGTLQSAHFSVVCDQSGAIAHEQVVAGLPRVISFGFGVNTEGFIVLRGSWMNSRLGKTGSTVELKAFGSSKTQYLLADANWYNLNYPTRLYLRPLVSLIHENENPYEVLHVNAQILQSSSFDSQYLGMKFAGGPNFDEIKTIRGFGAEFTHFTSLEGTLSAATHDFEFYRKDPTRGFNAHVKLDLNSKGLLSSATGHRLNFGGEGLVNFNDFDPPLFILGIRGEYSTTITHEVVGADGPIPPNFQYFLGGSLNLRGFGRDELTINGAGGLTSFFSDVEIRLSNTLPARIDPFIFMDAGALGSSSFGISLPIYYSPGVGLRWDSPVGVFRTTGAVGYPVGPFHHFQFYLSYGEEF